MAVIRDMIPPFELFQPTGVDDAVRLMRQHGDKGWVLAGGLDTFDWFKDRIKRPEAVIDLGGVEELQGIAERGGRRTRDRGHDEPHRSRRERGRAE